MNDHDPRPDPDALLASIQREEQAKNRGRLKIFFGMCAGVGKTYAMLKAAQALSAKGVDIVIGLVETHGRAETEALIEGLEIIPRSSVTYRGVQVPEMDLDAVLRRKPAWVLVDELAHTNTAGMRHLKRYQDVIELLDNNINVFTTLNVQHVESLVDTVRQISGITVRETVPDGVLDAADEIELVDLAPAELLVRLSEGKVYTPDRSAAAIDNFFRTGNLTALREIALRKTAQRVDLQLKDYMQRHSISGPWKTVERLMVAVGPSPYSEQLIRWTRRIASTMEAPWIAVNVLTSHPPAGEGEKRLKKNIALAQELGATLVTTTDNDIVKALIRTARQNNVTQIVVGKSMTSPLLDLVHGGSLVNRLVRESGAIDIYVVQGDTALSRGKRPPLFQQHGLRSPAWSYWIACGAIAGAAAACSAASSYIDYRSVGMFLLFVIAILSLSLGRGPVFIAAALGATVWDFLFIPPRFTFSISLLSDVLLLSLFFIVSTITGVLTSRIRAHEAALRSREEATAALYDLVNELSAAESADEIARDSISRIGAFFRASVVCYLSDSGNDFASLPHPASTFSPDSSKEWNVAQWVYRNKQPAGRGTATLPFAGAHYYPLVSKERCMGVIGIAVSTGGELPLDREGLLQMFLHQVALALERMHLRADRLGKTILNSISHELRTPLATITGASSSLGDPAAGADPKTREVLIGDIQSAAGRLNRLVGNLLNMSRLESGVLTLSKDWCDVNDLINAVLSDLRAELAGRAVKVSIQPDMPLARLDAALIEQALLNIVLNAAQYTPENSPVTVNAGFEPGVLVFSVEDEGPGISPEATGRIFDKFYRGRGAGSGGTGLGLSIAKGFVELHNGSIEARNRPSGGAQFYIRLPLPQKGP